MNSTLPSPDAPAPHPGYLRKVVFALALLVAVLGGALAGLLVVYYGDLPQVAELERFRPNSITEVYDRQGNVIGSFALQRRVIAGYDDFPKVLRDAVISIEDKDFERHWGIDVWRIVGAAYRDLVSGSRAQGASTLTMQLSRNLFLSSDRTFSRKLQEIMLAIQIERRFTKAQIFTLYANQIYLGSGVYGFEAGAEYYFSEPAKELTLPEAALLASLPKAPSTYSPVNNPEHALRRRNLVLNSMLEDGKITLPQAEQAKNAPLGLHLQRDSNLVAPYFVEELRRHLEKKYGSDQVLERGLRVYTTLDLGLQRAAERALLNGLAAYERRHGWQGKLKNILAQGESLSAYSHPDWEMALEPGSYVHGVVTAVSSNQATIKLGEVSGTLTAAEMQWTQHRQPSEILSPGDLVYVRLLTLPGNGRAMVALEQDSGAQGALLAVENATGEVRAMVGGRDFADSKFNHATQALRQTGSSFKPYVYTAAIDQGATPDDVIDDSPITFVSGSGLYTPHNYDNRFEGRITLRRALAQSRNIPALKLAQHYGIRTVIEYVRRFGITEDIPPYLPIALGAADMTLYDQVMAYATFPNDGVRVTPHYLRKVTDYGGHTLEEDYPEAREAISVTTARTMTAMLQEVTAHGTAAAAARLKHPLAGKTGTTNDFTDAWFIGFSPSITCGVWIGFDEKKTLGPKETGSRAALPVWMDFMQVAIAGRDDEKFAENPPPSTPQKAREKLDTPDIAAGDGEAH